MAFRLSRLALSTQAVPAERLRVLLRSCGLQDVVDARGIDFAKDVASRTAYQQFAPLFTPYFTLESHHLTLLGDTIIDEFLSRLTLDYAAHTGLVLTVNATKQLHAVLHNHYTLRLFAKELRFDELMTPLTLENPAEVKEGGNGVATGATMNVNDLTFLEPQRVGLRGQDVLGTSFHVTPLRSGQSPLGWMFSHFVGAVQQVFGREAAQKLLQHVYGGDLEVGLPSAAAVLLLRTLEHFPPGNVAEALLAAQGLPLRFAAKTRVLPDNDINNSNSNGNDADGGVSAAETGGCGGERDDGVVCSGFGVQDAMRDAATLDGLAASRNAFASLAVGPGAFDAVGTWKQRVQRELQLQQQPESVLGGVDDGWLQPEERRRYARGEAFYNSVDFSAAAATYFADAYGVQQPVNGQKIARMKFKKPVRDPVFYDTQSDMRNGVPFSTGGEPLTSYIDRLTQSHARLFEVTLVVGTGEGRAAGRAIATRYTVARESACKAYLCGVLQDLHTMKALRSSAV